MVKALPKAPLPAPTYFNCFKISLPIYLDRSTSIYRDEFSA